MTFDPAERERLITEHMPRALRIAAAVTMPPSLREDARSDAVIGLITAVDTFDPSHGAPLAAWVGLKVSGAVIDGLRHTGWVSRKAYRENVARVDAGGQLDTRAMLPVSLDAVDDDLTLGELVAVPSNTAEVDHRLELEWLAELIDNAGLPSRERRVVDLHLAGLNFVEIAEQFGVTSSRISQMHASAVRRLRRVAFNELQEAA